MRTITLADGQITRGDTLVIVLAQPDDAPPTILIRWPANGEASVTAPTQLGVVAQATMRTFARAVAQLALIRAAQSEGENA